MSRDEVFAELAKAREEFERIFGEPARTAGAAGWQANAMSLEAYDAAGFLYGSDVRGSHAFFPRVNGKVFKTLQIPTTLPTLDELLGRPEYPEDTLIDRYLSWMRPGQLNVLTIHAELEGMKNLELFHTLLMLIRARDINVVRLDHMAHGLLRESETIPACDVVDGTVDGRSGTMAIQVAA